MLKIRIYTTTLNIQDRPAPGAEKSARFVPITADNAAAIIIGK
jgi:hypothetical protein